jgi:O-antigen/teichoic acid export membrane protein
MTQLITWLTFSTAILISLYSEEILYSLTGDKRTYVWGREILLWYALGSSIFTLGTFQYYLQNAFGTLRLYVIGSSISLLIQVPLIYYTTTNYGALGAGQLWFAFSMIWFLGWTSVVHNKLIPGFHLKWLMLDLLPMVITILILSYALSKVTYIDMNASRFAIAFKTAIVGICFLTATSLCVRSIRNRVFEKLMVKVN